MTPTPADFLMTAADPTGAWLSGLWARIESDSAFAALRTLLAPASDAMCQTAAAEAIHRATRDTIMRNLSSAAEAMMIAAIDSYLRRDLGLPAIAAGDDASVHRFADSLAQRSFAVLPALPAAQVAAMRAHFEQAPARPGDNADGGETCSLATARRQSPFARYPTNEVMACPHLVEIATDPVVLATVERHLGTLPTTLAFAAWWSFAAPHEAEKTQLFHWDSSFDYRYCKMLVYLTDVDMDSGPHRIIEGTHNLATIDAVRRRQAASQREFMDWYLPATWKSDAETARYFTQPVSTITGSAGTRFIANTRAIHKAVTPHRRDRLIAQAIYGVSPVPQVKDIGPRPASAVRGGTLPRWVTERPFDYVNRLFLTAE